MTAMPEEVEQDRVIRPSTVEVADSGLATNPVVKRDP